MSVLRQIFYATGLTLKTVLRDYSTGAERLWNTVTPGFEAYVGGNIASYGISATEGSPGNYTWAVPSTLAASTVGFDYDSATYRLAGVNLATGDLAALVWDQTFGWTGTVVEETVITGTVSAAAITAIQSGLATPTNITAGTISTVTNVSGDVQGKVLGGGAGIITGIGANTNLINIVDIAQTGGDLAAKINVLNANVDVTVGSRAIAGDRMDLINAPNAVAVAAIQLGLANATNQTAVKTVTDQFRFTVANKVDSTATVSGVSLSSSQVFNNTGQTTPYPTNGSVPGYVAINQNTGGTDALTILAGGNPVVGATIRVFLPSAYTANPATAQCLGATTSDTSGHWLQPVFVPPGATYAVVVSAVGDQTQEVDVTV